MTAVVERHVECGSELLWGHDVAPSMGAGVSPQRIRHGDGCPLQGSNPHQPVKSRLLCR